MMTLPSNGLFKNKKSKLGITIAKQNAVLPKAQVIFVYLMSKETIHADITWFYTKYIQSYLLTLFATGIILCNKLPL